VTAWARKPDGAVRDEAPNAFLDEGSEIEGTYTFRGTVMLNGRLTGRIESTGTLIVGDKGVVKASIRAGRVVVHGEVVGNIAAAERIELRGRARVLGDLEAPAIVVDEGVLFEGRSRMTQPGTPEIAAP
jgi:cytoskeletal protein CcmA (bactofilin family)